jgi:hypothetical protein
MYMEDQQRLERKAKGNAPSSLSMPPVNITNVPPGPSHQLSLQGGQEGAVASLDESTTSYAHQLGIHGFCDDAL